MMLVERHIVRFGSPQAKRAEVLCHLCKNLYNVVNYILRQKFIAKEKLPSQFDLINQLSRERQVDYIALPPHVAQQVVMQVRQGWNGFFASLKEYGQHPEKYKARPRLPRYKDKGGVSLAVFTNQQSSIKNGILTFATKAVLLPVKTAVTKHQQVRIVPQATCFVVEILYEKPDVQADVEATNVLSIDCGLSNFATCVSNVGAKPFVLNGRPLKSINQFFNKARATAMSAVGNRGTSKRVRRLTLKRNCKVQDYIHKCSAYIRTYCVEHRIGTVIIGKNPDWKQNINLGDKTNQNFVSVPFDTFIRQLRYKLEHVGIHLECTEESYTSKVDHLAFEPLQKQVEYKGKRVKRGLFQSSVGTLLNADVNGAIGIARKVVGDVFVKELLDRGSAVLPVQKFTFA
jgi:putative transposase